MHDLLRWTLAIALAEIGLALLLVLVARVRAARLVGPTRAAQRGPRLLARVLEVALLALAAGVLLTPDGGGPLPLALLAGAALLAWAQPVGTDGALGDRGVRHGWRARRLEDLEAWRLTGDHLRVRLGGEWVAVAVPRALHGEARLLLADRCAARESRFRV
jgi:hypothetical protein